MSANTAVHAIISGRVQGVWYRAWTEGEANKLGLSGWVRNRRDGTVEAVFCGSQAQILEMVKRCHQGPPLARVDHVAVEPTPLPSEQGFFKRPTE